LKLDFTGAAQVADLSIIDDTVRQIILGIVNGMFTLPNRYFLRMDMTSDYFKTFHEPLGVLRITVEKASGFAKESSSKTKKLFAKLTRAAPDCYAKVGVGAEAAWKTSVKDNTIDPVWNETQDFVVSDYDQCVKIDIFDKDVNGDDEVGMAVTTVREIVHGNKHLELPMYLKDEEIDGRVSITCEYFSLETTNSSFTAEEHRGPNKLCGIANVLIASARNIKGQRDQLKPSVVVTWGAKNRHQTAIIADAPGTDINNPTFDQSFRMLGTSDVMDGSQNFRITLMNGTTEVGASEVSFEEVHKSPNMTLEKAFDVGNGTTVRASVCVRGVGPATVPSGASLPVRTA
jgi:Ca2+-dependent lipid-binding protein